MNVQVIAEPFGRLLRASPALAGAVHDLKAARAHGVIEALTDVGLCCWADKGYQGAGGTVPDHPRPSPGTSLTRHPPDDTALVPRRRGVGGGGAIEDRQACTRIDAGPSSWAAAAQEDANHAIVDTRAMNMTAGQRTRPRGFSGTGGSSGADSRSPS